MHWFWLIVSLAAWAELSLTLERLVALAAWLPDLASWIAGFFALYGRRRDLPLGMAAIAGVHAIYSIEPFGAAFVTLLVCTWPWMQVRTWIPKEKPLVTAIAVFLIAVGAGAARLLWPTSWSAGAGGPEVTLLMTRSAGAAFLAPSALWLLRRAWPAFLARDRVFG
ncbi:MAG: hypothetical protein RL885_01160 [Planctomycetota bacterium]